MKNKLHRFLGLHDWAYGEKYERSYETSYINPFQNKQIDTGITMRTKQDRTCKICGKIEVLTIDY